MKNRGTTGEEESWGSWVCDESAIKIKWHIGRQRRGWWYWRHRRKRLVLFTTWRRELREVRVRYHDNDGHNDMPYNYQHIRHGLWSVREEYYVVMHKLKSELHMSENQAQGAVCAVANILFGRKDHGQWKRYDKEKATNYNTLPVPTNTNRTEAYVEALILAGIARIGNGCNILQWWFCAKQCWKLCCPIVFY